MLYQINPGAGTGAFSPFDWVLFVVQILLVGAGIYLFFVRRDNNTLRRRLLGWLGGALLVAGVLGLIVGGLRLGGVGPFLSPIWLYAIVVAELVGLAFAGYYARFVYPRQLSTTHTDRGRQRVGSTTSTSRPTAPTSTRSAARLPDSESSAPPESRTSRRDARRSRKRKGR
ncbi:MAG: hypothetical protein HC914_01340 [Chloroflexaceae bacterium]|nr:hypothetical protein [Chloroflexaceae bacterium]